MSTSTIQTNIELNTVANILNLDIWGFNGFTIPAVRITDQCNGVFEQTYGDRATRDDLARAINSAESLIEEQLGYNMMPKYEIQTLYTPTYKKPYELSRTRNLQTDNKGYLVDIAKEKRDFLGTFAVVREDMDNNGVGEVCTLNLDEFRTLDPNEIRVFYKDTDVEIRPIDIKDSGVTRKATTQMYNIGKWTSLNKIDFEPLDYADEDSFETELDVWHIYSDKTSPVKLIYPPVNFGCDDGNNPDCLPTFTEVCGYPSNKKLGYFTHTGQIIPEEIEVGIFSGWTSQDQKTKLRRLDRRWEMATVALAVSLLEKEISCSGDNENKVVSKWQKSIYEMDPSISRVLVTQPLSDNMFGIGTYGSYLARQLVHANRLWPR